MEQEAPFKVGDKVITDFIRGDEDIARRVISCTKRAPGKITVNGWRVSADGGRACPVCGKTLSEPITGITGYGIDSDWFKKVRE